MARPEPVDAMRPAAVVWARDSWNQAKSFGCTWQPRTGSGATRPLAGGWMSGITFACVRDAFRFGSRPSAGDNRPLLPGASRAWTAIVPPSVGISVLHSRAGVSFHAPMWTASVWTEAEASRSAEVAELPWLPLQARGKTRDASRGRQTSAK